MRLELFNIIDDACIKLRNRQDDYIEAEVRVVQCLKSILYDKDDQIVEFSSRIKSETSLREKIIRNKLYNDFKDGDEILGFLHDLIGVTIKCQFISDENEIFYLIKNSFNKQNYNGLYYNEKFPNVLLNLQMKQPQKQKNGFDIYRIDGKCLIGEKVINFELQIKALIYTFWSEIEHKVVYKNNNYSLNNEFITKMLDSVRNEMTNIDKQLNIIYDQIQFQSGKGKKRSLNEDAIKNVIAKSINDLFIGKIQESIGFTINFKKSCDIMSEFLYNREINSFSNGYETTFDIGQRIERLKENRIDFESPIIFEEQLDSNDRFINIMSKAFLIYMNTDFEWFVFFKMLFELLPNTNIEDLKTFIYTYKAYFENDEIYEFILKYFDETQYKEIKEVILAQVATSLSEVANISILYDEKIRKVVYQIEEFTRNFITDLTTYDLWFEKQYIYLSKLDIKIKECFDE